MIWVALVLVVSSASIAFAVSAPQTTPLSLWGPLALGYGALAGVALARLRVRGVLAKRLAPRWGDPSLGALSGLFLLAATWVGRSQLMPAGSSERVWLMQLYWLLGDPATLQRSVLYTLLVLFVPLCEELVWRGLVLEELRDRLGPRRAWPVAALLYALVAVPTAFTLAIPGVGLNPLLVLGALGCGLVWTFIANQSGRLPAAMLSHAAFTYFSATQFRLPGM